MPDRTGLASQQALRMAHVRPHAVSLLVCILICAALLGGCGVSVKPSGQVVTGISVGR